MTNLRCSSSLWPSQHGMVYYSTNSRIKRARGSGTAESSASSYTLPEVDRPANASAMVSNEASELLLAASANCARS